MRAPARRSTDAEPGRLRANDRYKQRSRSWTWIGLSIATVIHFALLAFVPITQYSELPPDVQPTKPIRAIRLLPRIEMPRLPERIAPIAPPILSAMPPIDDDFEVERLVLTDELLESSPIPEPPISVKTDEMAGFQYFVPSMVKPQLVNRDEVRRNLEREYPRYLQNAGVGGALMIQFWIDENGSVHKYEIKKSSGRKELDEAAERVVPTMKFRPAYKLGRPVKIIVALPVRFETS